MTGVTFFYESCPVCGRQLRIPVRHFGRLMECSHCRGEFVAGQPAAAECQKSPLAAPSDVGVVLGGQFGSPQCGEV